MTYTSIVYYLSAVVLLECVARLRRRVVEGGGGMVGPKASMNRSVNGAGLLPVNRMPL